MRSLLEIIEATKAGEKPDYEELRYALLAVDALLTFSSRALMRLADKEKENRRIILAHDEDFRRVKAALGKTPKEWVGWNNDPENPEYQRRIKVSRKLFDHVMEKMERDKNREKN